MEVLQELGDISANELGRRAVPPMKGQTITHIIRMRDDPDYEPDTSTLRRIADGTGYSHAWLATGRGPRRTDAGDGEAAQAHPPDDSAGASIPALGNVPNWPRLIELAVKLDDARGVPLWAFEMSADAFPLALAPTTPEGLLSVAKLAMRHHTPEEGEAWLASKRAKQGIGKQKAPKGERAKSPKAGAQTPKRGSKPREPKEL